MLSELILNGLVEGCLLALICVGYSLAYGTAGVMNFAHADVMIAGGGSLVLLWLAGAAPPPLALYGMPLLFGLAVGVVILALLRDQRKSRSRSIISATLIALAIAFATRAMVGRLPFCAAALLAVPMTGCLASAVYIVGYRSLISRGAPRTSILLASLGISIMVQSSLLILWKSERRVFPPESLPAMLSVQSVTGQPTSWMERVQSGTVELGGGLWLPVYDLAIVGVFALIAIALSLFFRYSRMADAIVATADSRLAARACGLPVDRVVGFTFFLGGAIASFGGTLYVLRAKSLHPQMGFSVGLIAFVACVLGGIGSLRGSIIGAMLVSFVISFAPAIPLEACATRFLPESVIRWLPSMNLADWSYGVVYLMMILTILIRPRGLFA
jgi:branched-chain amino acid transport system permease protein